MTSVAYVQTNLIPAIALIILFCILKKHLESSVNNKLFFAVSISISIILTVEALTWAIDGQPGQVIFGLMWATNFIYFFGIVFCPIMWIIYVYNYIEVSKKFKYISLGIISLIFLAYIWILLINSRYGLLFYVDNLNKYHRGKLIIIQQLLSVGLILFSSVVALVKKRNIHNKDKKRDCLIFSAFSILPTVGGAIQVLSFGMSLIWSFAAASVIFLYLNIQNSKIYIDPMTKIYNRRKLYEYLTEWIKPRHSKCGTLYVINMDIDNFKDINDNYGHPTGDKVIIATTQCLSDAFSKTEAFIARQGGDEMSVIINENNEKNIKGILDRFQTSVRGILRPLGIDRDLTLSIGCTRYDYSKPTSVDKLMNSADREMYIVKESRKVSATKQV